MHGLRQCSGCYVNACNFCSCEMWNFPAEENEANFTRSEFRMKENRKKVQLDEFGAVFIRARSIGIMFVEEICESVYRYLHSKRVYERVETFKTKIWSSIWKDCQHMGDTFNHFPFSIYKYNQNNNDEAHPPSKRENSITECESFI